MEILFKILNFSVIPAWILLALFPNNKLTKTLVLSYAWHIVLAVLYTIFILWGMYENAGGEGGMDSLESLRIGFLNDKILLAAWAHYLIFDLFVGVWIVNDAQKRNISQWRLIPILFLTLMFGPIGFLFYFFKRMTNKINLD